MANEVSKYKKLLDAIQFVREEELYVGFKLSENKRFDEIRVLLRKDAIQKL
jgi:hypothetical protein